MTFAELMQVAGLVIVLLLFAGTVLGFIDWRP